MFSVIIRADGNNDIGIGHIMRCLSLAKAFKAKGMEVLFVSLFTEGQVLIRRNGFEVIGVNDGIDNDLVNEVHWLEENLPNLKSTIFVIDSYNVSDSYLTKLRELVQCLVYIDDLNSFDYNVDILLNGNITASSLGYNCDNSEKLYLLGLEYNLVRSEFVESRKLRSRKSVKNILITTGGGDPFRFSEKIVEILRSDSKFDNLELHLLVGRSFINKKELVELSNRVRGVNLHIDVPCVSEVMSKCDLAISSCGSTLYELCAMGVPTLGFIYASNQKEISEIMSRENYIVSLGWYDSLNKTSVIDSLSDYIGNFKMREEISQRQMQLVDGNGAERAVKKIIRFIQGRDSID